MKTWIRSIVVCLTIGFMSTSVAMADQFPVTVVDDRGSVITISSQPKAVASLSVFGADLLSKLGQKTIGVTTFNGKLPSYFGGIEKDMADLGRLDTVNFEVLTELEPDVLIAMRQYTEPYATKFEEIGHYLAYDMLTYQDSIRIVESASRALGYANEGKQMNADFEAQIAAYRSRIKNGVTGLFMWDWEGTPWVLYDHNMTTTLMAALNVKNVFGPSPTPHLPQPSAKPVAFEELLKLDPDVILVFKGGDQPIQANPVWQHLKAVKNGRAYRVGNQYAEPHGPLAREMVVKEMAYLFYPDIFSAPTDIPEAARAVPLTFVKN